MRTIAEAVASIPNPDVHWNEWVRIGMALFRASGGSQAGLAAWEAWSCKSPKHVNGTCEERWTHYAKSPPSSIGAGTIFFMARAEGWGRPHRLIAPVAAPMLAATGPPLREGARGGFPSVTAREGAAPVPGGARHRQNLRWNSGRAGRLSRIPRRRSSCAAWRERGRQVHAGQTAYRRASARPGRHPRQRRAGSAHYAARGTSARHCGDLPGAARLPRPERCREHFYGQATGVPSHAAHRLARRR